MIRQSVLVKLEKQKAKLAMDQQKEKTNSSKVKSPVNKKSKFTIIAPEKVIRRGRSSCMITLVKMKKNS